MQPLSSKHIVNHPETLVEESLCGLCYTNPHLRLLRHQKVILQANAKQIAAKQVTLMAGGGSGHEPGFAGYVGDGMLTAAVCGNVFASPSASQVLAAIEAIQSPHGTLVIVMNYTGDCLNFGMAVEKAKARGIKVDMLIVGDDVAVGRAKGGKVGRRGMAATSLVIKIAGALAAQGKSLDEVRRTAEVAAAHSATLGVALEHCHVPGANAIPSLPARLMELGMGIHNEPGCAMIPTESAKQLVGRMLDMILDQQDEDRAYLTLPAAPAKTDVVLLVNNLGAIASLEMHLVVKEAVDKLREQQHLEVKRVYVAPFLTSLAMPGFSLTLLALKGDGPEVLPLLDYPVQSAIGAAFVPYPVSASSFDAINTAPEPTSDNDTQPGDKTHTSTDQSPANTTLLAAIEAAAKAVIEAEPKVTQYDTVLGDGDCGQTLKAAALAIRDTLPTLGALSPAQIIVAIADTIDHTVGGTSSAIYCIYLNALAAHLDQRKDEALTPHVWAAAAKGALQSLQSYTTARQGDRTLMDALIPFVETLAHPEHTIQDAAHAARQGAESTRTMAATLGRASYVSADKVEEAAIPDAGAWGLQALLAGLASALQPTNT